jgi:hypothetical protein
MGKRPKGLTGISHLALQVFEKTNPASSNPNESNDQPSGDGATNCPTPMITEKHKAAPVTNIDSKQPRKRRKLNSHASQSSRTTRLEERDDATGLVPHYRNAHEVPSHLQKCVCVTVGMLVHKIYMTCQRGITKNQISLSESDISLSTMRDVYWMKKGGIASHLNA